MKKLVLSTIAAIGFALPAAAADLPVKAPVIAPIPTWAGVYVGINAGYSWADADRNIWLNPAYPITAGTFAGLQTPVSIDASGFTIGGTFGINFQTGNVVWGFESDLSWTDIDGSIGAAQIPAPAVLGNFITRQMAIDWFATVRGRLGYSFGQFMVYGTGGVAIASMKAGDLIQFAGGQVANGLYSQYGTGWVVGGGVEYAFAPRWSVKGEYLYSEVDTSNGHQIVGFATANGNHSQNTAIQFARLGINYRF